MIHKSNIKLPNEKLFFEEKSLREKIFFILEYAIRAPSTHNSQPWLFDVGENFCTIFIDESRILPYSDTNKRDLYISMGCLIENLIITAQYFNIFDRIEHSVNSSTHAIGDGGLVKIFFKDNTNNKKLEKQKHLFRSIPLRFNTRVFTDQKISKSFLIKIKSYSIPEGFQVSWFSNHKDILDIASLTATSIETFHNKKEFRKELASWIRHNLSSRKDGLPGYSLLMSTPVSFIFPLILKWFNLGKVLAHINSKSIIGAPLICVISSEKDEWKSWLIVGRISERIMLSATSSGLRPSVFVAAVESPQTRAKLKDRFTYPFNPQFIFALGYPKIEVQRTPRISVQERLVSRESKRIT